MAEDTSTAVDDTETVTDQPDTTADDWETSTGKGGKQAVLAELADSRKKARLAERELDKLRSASMSDQEKAIAEAKATTAAETARANAPRLVKAELRAAAAEAGLNRDALAGFLEYADLTKFVDDDGEPDSKAIAAAVKKLGGTRAPDFDGGARTTAPKPTDMNALIRMKAGLS